MSSLLTLAQDLEQNSKAQRQSTSEMLKAAFSEHEAYVNQELSESAKRINSAILDHDQKLSSAISQNTRGMLKTIGRTWLIIAGVSFLLICTSGSILWWQGQKILDNYQAISEQKDALSKLNARTWGVTYREDSNGRFLVLPSGMKGDTNWTVNDGAMNAVKLVQE
ncbi:MbeB family mobilization protein [Citrobacter portucalensis]|uniref:MbeB family mobilization protein n=1 Tax=Citrobacter freundii complex TaxID=1344959 RepID=UPI0012FFF9E6|nr:MULTISPECIES: MbeB family mobilization protein [Enterobacteriaceae]ECV7991197.1 mobilization protein [Salmonella enterica subsp. enterica serovar Enteritidis]EGZ6776123.1 mobilization protein [Escherichia coli]ELO4448993.1 MbeB family mobilization protein [Salmonella enterica subsp. enterica serovar London]EGZ6827647.1 mobilization protein [Escherichia coli]EKU4670116.1 MbeB family mobilization protein [Citrobacter freundii]